MIRWFVNHPVSVFLLITLIGLIGFISLLNIPIEIRPEVHEQVIRIVAYWGKQSPEVMQRVITAPLEDIASQIPELKSLRSTSGIGIAEILLRFPPQIELKYAYIELREKIATLRENLPRDAVLSMEPYSEQNEDNKMMRLPFFSLELSGNMQIDRIRKIADENVVPIIKSLDGVADIDVFGGSEQYLLINLDENKLKSFNLSLYTVREAIQKRLIRKGLGHIIVRNSRKNLIFDNLPGSFDDLMNTPILRGITLDHLGTVELHQDEPTSLSRHNYLPLVSIDIYKSAGINALEFSRKIKSTLEYIRRQVPDNLELSIVKDSSEDLIRELNNLLVRSFLILGIIFLLLLIMMKRLLTSVIILSTIFLSILLSSILLYLSGYTINVVTLAGIALIFGMLVDNAVVIVDNIHRHETMGEDRLLSAVNGAREMIQPLIASTATTIFVFFALLFLRDRLKDYYRPLAFSLGFSLLSSLFLAITLIPAAYGKSRHAVKSKSPGDASKYNNFAGPAGLYRKLIYTGINHPILYLLIFGLIFYGSYRLFSENVYKGGFINWFGKQSLNLYLNAPQGVTLRKLDHIVREFESRIKSFNVTCDVRTNIDARAAEGRIYITFPDSVVRSIKPYLMKQQLIDEATNYAGVGIYIAGFGMPYYNGGFKIPIEYNTVISISGPRYDRLQQICEGVLSIARKDRRVGKSMIVPAERNLYYSDFKNLELSVPAGRIWDAGISVKEILSAVEPYLNQRFSVGSLRLAGNHYNLVLSTQNSYLQLYDLLNKRISLPGLPEYRIQDIFNVKSKPISPWIDRENQQYRFCVAWEYIGPERMRARHEKEVIEQINLPPGYKLIEKQWGFLTREEEKSLLNLILVVIAGTFMILASLYESFSKPFIVFFSVPLSLIGIFLAYVVFNREFNVNSYIGLIILTGIVVNNAIILVDRIKRLIESKNTLVEAIIQGSMERIRPIMITTLTTIGGLTPLLFMPESESSIAGIMKELSFITVSGIAGSTFLTITFIPVLYYSIERIKRIWRLT